MNDNSSDNPEIMAGVAMSLARERAALREKAEETGSEARTGGFLTAVVVVAVLVGMLALMIFRN